MASDKKMAPLQKGGGNSKRSRASKGSSKVASRKIKTRHERWVFNPRLGNMAAVLHNIDPSIDTVIYDNWVNHQRELVQKTIRNHGFTMGAKRIKQITEYTLSLVEGRNPENPPWLATSEAHRVPSCLDESFIQYIVDYLVLIADRGGINTTHRQYQVIHSVLTIHRLFKGLVDAELDSVIEKAKPIDSELLEEFESYVTEFIQSAKDNEIIPPFETTPDDFEGPKFKLLKNGPNSLPKLETAHCEAIKLRGDKLWQPFNWLSKLTGQTYLSDYVAGLALEPIPANREEGNIPIDKINLRKISAVPDTGFKTRLVAISDFWTQAVLAPIRAHVQLVTEKLFSKYDFRLDQQGGVNAMIAAQKSCLDAEDYDGLTLSIKMLKAYDISAWTDRFHRDLQKIVMRNLFNSAIAERWAQLTVHCEWYVPSLDSHIKYGQGQGMGTNGSFDIATLTDHLFIHFLYAKEYGDNFIPLYGKVGDDLWILDPKDVYPDYCKRIHLPINMSKSKVFCELGSVMEFCSRTAINGIDYSRISPNVINRSKDFRNIPELLSVLNERGISVTPSSFPSLSNNTKETGETYLDKLQPWLLSAVCANYLAKENSPYRFLTAQYLIDNYWITKEDIYYIIQDPETLIRLAVVQNILSITESFREIKKLNRSLSKYTSREYVPYLDEVDYIPLLNTDTDLADKVRRKIFKDDLDQVRLADGSLPSILLPIEIIPLERLKLLSDALTIELYDATKEYPSDLDGIIDLATRLKKLSVSTDFEGLTLNYDSKRAYNANFKIVKYLEKTAYPYNKLEIDTQRELDSYSRLIGYDEVPTEWTQKFLPELISIEQDASV